MTNLVLPRNSLAVFIDETGHEDLPTGHSIYALGGCAVLEQELDKLIRAPWKSVRRDILGDSELPLHASAISKTLAREKQALIGGFFSQNGFMRVATAVTTDTKIPDHIKRLEIIAPTLIQRIINIFKWTGANSMSLIFESNERANPLIEEYFGGIKIQEDGKNIPLDGYFMPKSANDPALEVADFIVHSVHGLAHDRLNGREGYNRLDFKSVFQSVDRKLADFILVDEVTQNPPVASQ